MNIGEIGVGTPLPAWGIDVEGSGLASEINTSGGYLANGLGGNLGQCLGSNGTAFIIPVNCGSTNYYQTVYANGTSLPQEAALNFNQYFTATDVPGTNTTIGIVGTGSEGKLVTAASSGPTGDCMQWDVFGGAGSTGQPCLSVTTVLNCLTVSCAGGSTYASGVTYTNSSGVPVFEDITMAGPGPGSTGCDYELTSTINSLTGPSGGITNDSRGWTTIPLMVPAGATFSATATQLSGGGGCGSFPGIIVWIETPM